MQVKVTQSISFYMRVKWIVVWWDHQVDAMFNFRDDAEVFMMARQREFPQRDYRMIPITPNEGDDR